MRSFSRLAALVCVIYYVFGFCMRYEWRSSGKPESNTSFNCCNRRDGGSHRRGRWYQMLCSFCRSAPDRPSPERRTPQGPTQEGRTSEPGTEVRTTPGHSTRAFAPLSRSRISLGQKSIIALSKLRNEYTPSCSFEQESMLSTDYTPEWECWESATPVGTAIAYKVLHPVQAHAKTWSLALKYSVIAHPGCVIVEVTKNNSIGGNSTSGNWLLEMYPTVVPDAAQDDVTMSMQSDMIPFLVRGLQFYKQPDAAALLSRLRVLLPAAVLERVNPIRCTTEPPTTLARASLLRWRTVGTLEQFINSLYEKQVIYQNVTTRNALAGLMSITEQLIKLVARLHKEGFVIGDLTADKFVVGEVGVLYLDGMKHLKQAMNLKVPESYAYLLHSPPEVSSGQAMSFSILTDTWQLGLLLLQLWCGGFRSSNQSLWEMRHSRAIVSYHQVRAGLASTIDFGGCVGQAFGEVKYVISSFLKPGDRVTPYEMMNSKAYVYISEAVA